MASQREIMEALARAAKPEGAENADKKKKKKKQLEAKVREQLKADFPNIESNKSYELLVDAVMHNLRKKQLQAEDNIK